VLMPSGQPIAFLSKALKGRAVHMSTYEKRAFCLGDCNSEVETVSS